MKDPISKGLVILAKGLRPYVTDRIVSAMRNIEFASEVERWDAQALMIFMWDRWNDLFRGELSFVERSLLSELRDFRNRWAHQDGLEEKDVYRVLDDIERLLIAIHSPEAEVVALLRRESLNRLWTSELGIDEKQRRIRLLWPYLLCGASGVALDMAILTFGPFPWSWLLSLLVMIAMMRLAYVQSTREAQRAPGPHECSHCGRIVYSVDCPYCNSSSEKSEHPVSTDSEIPLILGSLTGFRLPKNIPHSLEK